MFPPFPTERAHDCCARLLAQIASGSLVLRQVSAPSEERDGHGIMLGALICTDDAGTETVLAAVSGNSLVPEQSEEARREFSCVWAPPLVASAQIAAALEKNDRRIHELTAELHAAQTNADRRRISGERAELTSESLAAVHALYQFHTIFGTVVPLKEICAGRMPPTGTGDCCAPKLLDYAFAHHLHPVSMDEVYCGRDSANKKNGVSYPPCDERCGIVLPAMLGVEIVYRDSDIIVVNKQPGLLSVPGRGPEKQDCIVSRVRRLFPACIVQPSVHRLDMETSGLLVLAFTEESHRNLSLQFQNGTVQKKYTALLDGVVARAPGAAAPQPGQQTGTMTLFFRLDIDNRPHQIWDTVYGKPAVTEWEIAGYQKRRCADGTEKTVTRILFTPHTGRTHQLRLASSDMHGFGMPIVGDTLYGTCEPGGRLMLHAHFLSFTHPVTGERMKFESRVPF